MENTNQIILEGETQPVWFMAVGDTYVGPLSGQDVLSHIQSGQVTWAHFIWKEGMDGWKRICDVPSFQAAVPHAPSTGLFARIQEQALQPQVKKAETGRAATPSADPKSKVVGNPDEKIWFLFYNETQFGPFSFEEVSRFLRIGKIHGRVFAWKDGMTDWERLEKLVIFGDAVDESARARAAIKESQTRTVTVTMPMERRKDPNREDRRTAPRRPLVARILLTNENDDQIVIAICRDVSVGGMQVLTDKIPGDVGTVVRMNVSPTGHQAGATSGFRPFVAQGVIVRVLEDGRGFCFRFDKLRGDSKRSIEEYVEAVAAESRPS